MAENVSTEEQINAAIEGIEEKKKLCREFMQEKMDAAIDWLITEWPGDRKEIPVVLNLISSSFNLMDFVEERIDDWEFDAYYEDDYQEA